MIAAPSLASLLVAPKAGDRNMAVATAFVVDSDQGPHLITNWHVVMARNPRTNADMDPERPDALQVWHRQPTDDEDTYSWDAVDVPLRNPNGEPRWLVHPDHGQAVDAVALPLQPNPDVMLDPYVVSHPDRDLALLNVTTPLSIIGFPFGVVAAARIAVWVQGTIATEPEVPYMGLPCMLIDSRTRAGQSGSPVILYSGNGAVPTSQTHLVGVYSGRINESSDLGFVWRSRAIAEIIDGGQLDQG